MNRLAPLIVRAPARSGPARARAVGYVRAKGPKMAEDVGLFVTAFLGGLVFFGTMIA
ncbi:MAG TPA: hypothetical protein VF727_11890 [Allosphingosinicella sp.]|jgi:hypothetical protein